VQRAGAARKAASILFLSTVLLAGAAGAEGPALRHAKALSIERRGGATIARVLHPWRGASRSCTDVFIPRGAARPSDAERDAVIVETPVRKAAAFSASYVAAIEALGEIDSLAGVDNASYVYSEKARARLAAGLARETSRNWMPDVELLASIAPDVVFSYATGNEWDSHQALSRAGLTVAVCAEWMEDSPLGRAEWLKFFALFYGKSKEADAAFDAIERAYESARASAAVAMKGRKKPVVLVNAPFQGAWNVPGGRSYLAALVRDAGGDYLWADDPGSGALSLSMEAAYERALGATVWINPGTAASLSELQATDRRFAGIPALARGAVFSNTRKTLPSGANDYFEGAAFSPHILLSDLAAVFAAAGSDPVKEPASLEYYRLLE